MPSAEGHASSSETAQVTPPANHSQDAASASRPEVSLLLDSHVPSASSSPALSYVTLPSPRPAGSVPAAIVTLPDVRASANPGTPPSDVSNATRDVATYSGPEAPHKPQLLINEASSQTEPESPRAVVIESSQTEPASPRDFPLVPPESSQTEPESPREAALAVNEVSSQTEPESPSSHGIVIPSSQTEPESPRDFPFIPLGSSQTEPESPREAQPAVNGASSQTEPENPHDGIIASSQTEPESPRVANEELVGPAADETQVIPDSEGEEELHIPLSPASPDDANWDPPSDGSESELYEAARAGLNGDWRVTQIESFYDKLFSLR